MSNEKAGYNPGSLSYSNVLASLFGSPSPSLLWFLRFFELLNPRTQIGAFKVFRKNDRQHDGHYTVNVIRIHINSFASWFGLGSVSALNAGWAAYNFSPQNTAAIGLRLPGLVSIESLRSITFLHTELSEAA